VAAAAAAADDDDDDYDALQLLPDVPSRACRHSDFHISHCF